MTTATVVICTHDRARVLAQAVRGALGEARACDADVLVVDNASTDETPALLAALARTEPRLRVVREPVLGLSIARNRGLAEARGAVAVYLDDDAVPHRGWLAALLAPYDDARVAAVGGRILLRFATPPPAWLTAELHPAYSGFDLGDGARRVRDQPGDEFPYGANISFRVARARALGGFSAWIGPRGRVSFLHDETDLCLRLDQAGDWVRYAPDAVVDHEVPAERMTPVWLIARHRHRGESGAIFALRNRGVHRALGHFRWHHAAALGARPYRPVRPFDGERLLAECRRQEAIGYLRGLARGLLHLRALRDDVVTPSAALAVGR